MKKVLTLALSLSLVFSLTACGGNNSTKVDNQKTPAASQNAQEDGKITGKQLVRNVHARKAIMLTFDKEYITEVILGTGALANDFFVPKEFATLNGKDFREFAPDGWHHLNLEEAKKEWKIAKKELGIDEATVTFTTFDGPGATKKIAEAFQSALEENLEGLHVNISQQPFKNKIAKAAKGEFDMEIAGWNPDYPDPMTFLDMWAKGSGQNTIGFDNAEYNKIIADCKSGDLAAKAEERWKALQRAEEILVKEEAVVMPLFQQGASYAQKSYLKNLGRHKFGGPSYKQATTEKSDENGKHIIHLSTGDDIPTLDPSKATNEVTFEIIRNSMENLVMLDLKDEVEPGVAEKWEVSEDGKTYTFHLRDSKWSNGEAVTAKDFEYSWKRLADPKTASQYQFMIETIQLKNFKGVMSGDLPVDELGVKATDDKTLVVELEQPVPFFLKTITLANFAPLNQKFVEEKGDQFAIGEDNLLYNGAYMLDKVETGYGYELIKNPSYWDTKNVMNDGVTFRNIKDNTSKVNLYQKDEIDLVGILADFLEQYQDSEEYHTKLTSSNMYIIFNVGNDGKKADAKEETEEKATEEKKEEAKEEQSEKADENKKEENKEEKSEKSDDEKAKEDNKEVKEDKSDKKADEEKKEKKKEESKEEKKDESKKAE